MKIQKSVAILLVNFLALSALAGSGPDGDRTEAEQRGSISEKNRFALAYGYACENGSVSSVQAKRIELIPAGIEDRKDAGGFEINRILFDSRVNGSITVSLQTLEVKMGEVTIGNLTRSLRCSDKAEVRYDNGSESNVEASKNLQVSGTYRKITCFRHVLMGATAEASHSYDIRLSDSINELAAVAVQRSGRSKNKSILQCEVAPAAAPVY